MIGNALRVDIERFVQSRVRKNSLFQMTERGEIGRACVRGYLENLHYLISHSPQCLRRAAERSAEIGEPKVARFFEQKFAEEVGHEVWAERDIASMSESSTALIPVASFAMRDLVQYILDTIESDPVLYLAYIVFAEYLTVIIGPEWVKLLDERCGIPATSMTVITKHVELDVEHAEHIFEEIDDLVGDPAKLPALRAMLNGSMDRYERFCSDLAVAHTSTDEQSRSAHVTAA